MKNKMLALLVAVTMLLGSAMVAKTAVSDLAGLAVAQSSTVWANVRDAAAGDNLTGGILASGLMFYDGTNFDRARGDTTFGLDVDVTRLAGITSASDNSTNPSSKLPVLPCVANSSTPTWTNGNVVPCTVDTSGRSTVNQGATSGSGVSVWNSTQTQGFTLFNSQTTGAANTAVTATIAAAASVRAQLYEINAYCSAGTATLTVTDGGTTIWATNGAEVPSTAATRFVKQWPTALTGATNSAMVVTLGTCGVGNTGTLAVQASRW